MVRRASIRRGALAASALAASALAACRAGPPRAPAAAVLDGSDITLYRDGAIVRQRVELDVPAGGAGTLRIRVPAGLGAGDILVFPQGGVTVTELRQAGAVKTQAPPPLQPAKTLEEELAEETPAEAAAEPDPAAERPVELELVALARPGRVAFLLGYVTARLTWEVAYTVTANAAHDRAVLRGAIAIHNTTGIALPAAAVRLIDTSLAAAKTRAAEALTGELTREKPRGDASHPPPRELGRLDVVDGDTRVELVRAPAPRPMRSVLVYDPIGAQYDRAGRNPAPEPDLGVRPPAGARVDESFEIERDPAITAGLPAGPVRLLERRADGSLALLGQARLFEATARVAISDTIVVGAAEGVTGDRERRELTIDNDRQRVVEDFVITIDNARSRPAEVVVREHLYRGTNWTLAYISVPVGEETKEGPQQVAPRLTVPPHGKARLLYSVVYWW
jgi:hypothetical protein